MKRFIKRLISAVIALAVVCGSGIGLSARTVLAYNAGIETFVNSLYADCLGRTADPAGLEDWCNRLASGQITGKQAAYGFFFSQEFVDRVFTPESLIDTFYTVFLNRAADPDGKAYWLSQINTNMDFMFADTLLFDGFADSAEFASKCASYGIIAGDHVDTSNVDVRPSEDPLYASSCPDFFDCLQDVNGDRDPNGGIYGAASSPEALDEFWTRHGWEIWYIDLGDGNTQKCYAHFGDSATLNRLVNVFREANGVPPLTIIDDPNDPRVQWSRLRAVEGCYDMSHTRPNGERFGSRSENLCTAAPDNDAFTWFRMEYYHAMNMLEPYEAMSTAGCICAFVNPDGVTIYTARNSPNAGGMGVCAVESFW